MQKLDPNLYVDLIVCGSVYGTIEAKPDHKYPSVDGEPEYINTTVMQ